MKSPSFKTLGLIPDSLSDDDLVHLMLKEPRMIRRPIILINDKFLVGAGLKAINGIYH
jgi:arsenate reductase-like glutaredoxin family protein